MHLILTGFLTAILTGLNIHLILTGILTEILTGILSGLNIHLILTGLNILKTPIIILKNEETRTLKSSIMLGRFPGTLKKKHYIERVEDCSLKNKEDIGLIDEVAFISNKTVEALWRTSFDNFTTGFTSEDKDTLFKHLNKKK